ncbi:M48 family metalloprotease [Marinobacteraceae bacterium S3BR75-40.1]
MKRLRIALFALLPLIFLAGCAKNPVTGETQLRLISTQQEVAMGEKQYQPTMQIQGGEYRVDEELTKYVNEVGQKLAKVSDRPDLPYEFSVLTSDVPNAWALPGGKIAVNRGLLLALENEAQLAAVLGHEIVHAAASHSAQQMQKGMLINAGMAGLGIALSDNEYTQWIMGGAALGAQLTMAQYGQADELESDHYGMQYMAQAGYDPMAAVELQRIFVKLMEGQEQSWLKGLFASHPPSQERVEKNLEMAKKLGKGGRIGHDTYMAKTAHIRKTEPAYEKANEAEKLAKDKQYDAALAKIRDAQKIEPRQSSFHATEGEILKRQGHNEAAIKKLNRAIDLYPSMFTYHLQRGTIHEEMKNWQAARADYERSLETVPTALAHLGLGNADRALGNEGEAIEHYRVAAQADGKVGEAARAHLQAMGVKVAPGQ